MRGKDIPFVQWWLKTEKVKLAMLKKLATESVLQSQMLKEILATVKNAELKDVQMEYHKRYLAEMQRQSKWVLESMGLSDSIDWNGLFGYDPLQDQEE
jgi:hypothetical protein